MNMPKPLHEYACEDVVQVHDYRNAEMALHNALTTDAHPEELRAASRAAVALTHEAMALARSLREAAR